MKRLLKRFAVILMMMSLAAGAAVPALASDDNSLQSLGITTEGVTVTPEFSYDTWTYDVTVPQGTTKLELDPQPSSGSATISSLTGTDLNADGSGTVYITVKAETGSEFTYTLNVTGGAAMMPMQEETPAPQTEPPTEKQTEPPTEPQTEDSRFVRVDKNTIQEAQNTITSLKEDIKQYQNTISLYTKIMYTLIGLAVILLFIIINLILRKRDLKSELNEYRKMGFQKPVGKKNAKGGNAPVQAGQMPPNRPMGARPPMQGGQGRPVQGGQGVPAQGGQGVPAQGAPAQGGQGYRKGGGIDVRPQVSSKKNRRLPAYQEETIAPAEAVTEMNQEAKRPQGGNARQAQAPENRTAPEAQTPQASAVPGPAENAPAAPNPEAAMRQPEDSAAPVQPVQDPAPMDVEINMIDL